MEMQREMDATMLDHMPISNNSSEQMVGNGPAEPTTNHKTANELAHTIQSNEINNATIIFADDMELTMCAPSTETHSIIAPSERLNIVELPICVAASESAPITMPTTHNGSIDFGQLQCASTDSPTIEVDSGIESFKVNVRDTVIQENGNILEVSDASNMRDSRMSTKTLVFDIPMVNFDVIGSAVNDVDILASQPNENRQMIFDDSAESSNALSNGNNVENILVPLDSIDSIRFSDVDSDIQTHTLRRKRRAILSSQGSSVNAGSSTNAKNARSSKNAKMPGCATNTNDAANAARGKNTIVSTRSSMTSLDGSYIWTQIDAFIEGMNEPTGFDPDQSNDTAANVANSDESDANSKSSQQNDCASVADSLHVHIPNRSQVAVDNSRMKSIDSQVTSENLERKTIESAQSESESVVPVNDADIFKEPITPAATNRAASDSYATAETTNIEELENATQQSESHNVSVLSSLNSSCAFRMRFLRNSSHSNSLNIGQSQGPSIVDVTSSDANWLVHKSCSSGSSNADEAGSQHSYKSATHTPNKNVKPKKCFPVSSKIVYANIVNCSPMTVAVNHFSEQDPSVQFHLLGKFNRYKNLNINFNGTVFTTAPLSMMENAEIFPISFVECFIN